MNEDIKNSPLELTKPENVRRNLVFFSTLTILVENYKEFLKDGVSWFSIIGNLNPENLKFVLLVIIFYYFTYFTLFTATSAFPYIYSHINQRTINDTNSRKIHFDNIRIICFDYLIPTLLSLYCFSFTTIKTTIETNKLSTAFTIFRIIFGILFICLIFRLIIKKCKKNKLLWVLFTLILIFFWITIFKIQWLNLFDFNEENLKYIVGSVFSLLLFFFAILKL